MFHIDRSRYAVGDAVGDAVGEGRWVVWRKALRRGAVRTPWSQSTAGTVPVQMWEGVRQVPVQMWRHPPVPRAAHRDRLAGLPPVRRVQKRAAAAGHDEHRRICAVLCSSPWYHTVLRVPKPKSTESTEPKHRQSRRLRARRRSRRQVRAD
jgi:hypothetical protein